MSEKRSGPGKGRGSRFRPDASGAPPPPPKELVEDLLKEGDGDDGMGLCHVYHVACVVLRQVTYSMSDYGIAR